MKIRAESVADYDTIRMVNDLAFGHTDEGALVGKLRQNPLFNPRLSLVAEEAGAVVGHILFFPVWVQGEQRKYRSLALAPMSVLPEYQQKGIGSRLVRAGMEAAYREGHDSVIVLGHSTYYPRFGFIPASRFGISAPFEVPDEAFMAIELVADALTDAAGIVQYPPEFDEVG